MEDNRKTIRRIGGFRCLTASPSSLPDPFQPFVPWAEPPGDEYSWSITTVVDPQRHNRLRAAAASLEPVAVAESFAGESWIRRYRLPGEATLHLESHTAEHAVLSRGHDVTVVLGTVTDRAVRSPMRVLREAFHRSEEERGSVVMHAASCAVGNSAALIVGGKGAGKTTTLMTGCLVGQAGYLGNDRIVIPPEDAGWHVVGFPMVCRVHPGTIGRHPRLTALALNPAALSRPQDQVFHAGHADIDRLRGAAGPDTKLELTTTEIRERLGVPVRDRANLTCIVFPDVTSSSHGARMTPVPTHESWRRLIDQCLTPDDDTWVEPWLVERRRSRREMRDLAAARLKRLAQTVPAFELSYGHGETDTRGAADLLVERIAAS